MTTSTATMRADLDALERALVSALPAFEAAMAAARGAEGGAGTGAGSAVTVAECTTAEGAGPTNTANVEDALFERMSGPGVVRVVEAAAHLRRRVDAFLTRAADEVAKRSGPEFGGDGLAKHQGFANAGRLIATATGGSPHEAARFLAVGAATRSRSSFAGEPLPPKHPHARTALDAGELSLEAAAMVTGMLARAARRANPDLLGPYEATLVDMARATPLSMVRRAVDLAESRLDPDGVEPADEALREARSLTFQETANGMFRLRGLFDPVTAAPIKSALDALVSDALRRRDPAADRRSCSEVNTRAAVTEPDVGVSCEPGVPAEPVVPAEPGPPAGAGDGPVVDDLRTIPQLQADALAQLARHALGCSDAPTPLVTTTVVVRLSLEALRDGLGTAEIDGIDRPIAATSARRLAADAELIPCVLGTDGATLDLGRAARLFSTSQRLALAERDGGCASCGVNITYAEAHHIEWWARDHGRTDLDNGVLLCSSCHHRIHRDGWQIRATRTEVWFIPPPHIDPAQRPRRGGRARFDPGRPASPSPESESESGSESESETETGSPQRRRRPIAAPAPRSHLVERPRRPLAAPALSGVRRPG